MYSSFPVRSTISSVSDRGRKSPHSKRIGAIYYCTNVSTRIRRVKCDEAKPHCHRCTSTGRKCDGYSTQEARHAEHAPNTPSLIPSVSVDPCATTLEKRTFEFFRTHTAPCISGYFPDPVWDRYVLQTSQHEPTIRYASALFSFFSSTRASNDRFETFGWSRILRCCPE